MTDWSKLKVTDLKAELKKRGLLQTGLKAELVARLTSADNESGFESENTVKADSVELGLDSTSPTEETKSTLAESQPDVTPSIDSQPTLEDVASAVPVTKASNSQPDLIPVQDVTSSEQLEHEDSTKYSLPSVDTQEIVEDKQKRKRRSQSPIPSTLDVRRKRARADGESDYTSPRPDGHKVEALELEVDAEQLEQNTQEQSTLASSNEAEAVPSSTVTEPADNTAETVDEDAVMHHTTNSEVDQKGGEGGPRTGTERVQDTVSSTSLLEDDVSGKAKDSRFKGLFSNQTAKTSQELAPEKPTISSTSELIDAEITERHIAPSIHPATSALYIRDFMRPLNPASLKEHLTTLATAPGTTPDPGTIIDFYIDPIRTHAFILFKSVSAASRVRSELHDRIWPNERNRKPLWADFVPSETVLEWITEEQSSSGGARAAAKKWEVVFDTGGDGSVTAALREVGSFVAPARKASTVAPPLPPPAHPGIEGAPSGPRAQQINGQRSAPNRSALEALFKYTVAKPVLYFQPVSKEVAEKRLDHMEDATAKGYSSRAPAADIHRYTFEDGDVLVDRGPEIFSGIRPPPGYRGRGGGGGGGGGRGHFRNRGGDRYEGGRRDPRDRGGRDRDRDRDWDRDRRY